MHRVSMHEKLLFESSEDELKATDKTQIAITLANLAASPALEEAGVSLQGCAGFSLGEYAALCEAGVIRLEDVFPIVKTRGYGHGEGGPGALMRHAGAPGMAAVLGLAAEKVTADRRAPFSMRGFLSPTSTAPRRSWSPGPPRGLQCRKGPQGSGGQALREALGFRVLSIRRSWSEARRAFDEALAGYAFSDPKLPVYSNVTGRAITSGSEARRCAGSRSCLPCAGSPWSRAFSRMDSTGSSRPGPGRCSPA